MFLFVPMFCSVFFFFLSFPLLLLFGLSVGLVGWVFVLFHFVLVISFFLSFSLFFFVFVFFLEGWGWGGGGGRSIYECVSGTSLL